MTEKITNFKDICFKLGFVMTVFFASRILCTMIAGYIHTNLSETIGVTANYITQLSLSAIFLYGVPIFAAMVIFKGDNQPPISQLYKKPPRLAKAIGNFPAMYGLGQITNLLVLLAVYIASRIWTSPLDEGTLERSFGTMNSLIPPNVICGVVLFIHMVFAAAIFEELLCRGVLLNALKPYGNGFAIIVTGFLFGIMHGNFQQFSYSFILGIVLAYITIQTGSILAATILHAMFNSVAAVMMLFLSTGAIQDYLFTREISDEGMALLAGFGMYFALFIGLLVAGVALAVRKLANIKAYAKTARTNQPEEIKIGTRWRLFLTSVPVIIMLILTIDAFAGGFIAAKLYGFLWTN
jgi:hypothetical protein